MPPTPRRNLKPVWGTSVYGRIGIWQTIQHRQLWKFVSARLWVTCNSLWTWQLHLFAGISTNASWNWGSGRQRNSSSFWRHSGWINFRREITHQQFSFLIAVRSDCLLRAIIISSVNRAIVRFVSLLIDTKKFAHKQNFVVQFFRGEHEIPLILGFY